MPKKPTAASNPYEGWTLNELITQATRNAGATGSGAAAEINRRLLDSLEATARASQKQTEKLNRLTLILTGLTAAPFVLGLIQLFVLA
jgi:hypothetical protein